MNPSSRPDFFPERLRIAREKRELSQGQLAERSGLQGSAISHFETGTRRPSFANLRRLADALRVSTDYLLGRTDDMTGTASAEVMFRDFNSLSGRDQDMLRDLAAQMAAKKKKGDGGE